jgi:hypothetical protein
MSTYTYISAVYFDTYIHQEIKPTNKPTNTPEKTLYLHFFITPGWIFFCQKAWFSRGASQPKSERRVRRDLREHHPHLRLHPGGKTDDLEIAFSLEWDALAECNMGSFTILSRTVKKSKRIYLRTDKTIERLIQQQRTKNYRNSRITLHKTFGIFSRASVTLSGGASTPSVRFRFLADLLGWFST